MADEQSEVPDSTAVRVALWGGMHVRVDSPPHVIEDEIAARLRVSENDRPGTQAWKRRRLIELGYGIPDWLRLVPVDFEAGADWWEQLSDAGFEDVHHVS